MDEPLGRSERILTGDGFGAIRFKALGRLYGAQQRAAEAVIRAVHKIACNAFDERRRRPRQSLKDKDLLSLDDTRYFERPHHVFVVDGERGSGKTTVLLTLYGYLKILRLDASTCPFPAGPDDNTRADLLSLNLPPPPGASGSERVALVLPIVFPETMEPGETTMEAVFAHMDQELLRAVDEETGDPERKAQLEALRDVLRRKVGVAWMFSQKIGEQALASDALDYTDFVLRRADHNRQSYTRINLWRHFVDEFLNELRYETLVLAFDDSDLEPQAAEDILRSIRVYLSHPRIVTLMAVDTRTLQETALLQTLARREPGLKIADSVRTRDIVQRESENVAALLDKVLPLALRQRLETALEQISNIFDGDFDRFCRERLYEARQAGTEVGGTAALSWWLLSRAYRRLVADTIRRLVTFRAGVRIERSNLGMDDLLLDYSKFQDLSRVLDGSLDAIPNAVASRRLSPYWGDVDGDADGQGDGELSELATTMVDFWFDRETARRQLDVLGQPELAVWLDVEDEQTGPAIDAQRALGVAGLFRTRPVPRNCLYLHQYRTLSGGDLAPTGAPLVWTSQLQSLRLPPRSRNLDRLRAKPGTGGQVAALLDRLSDAEATAWIAAQVVQLRRPSSIALDSLLSSAQGGRARRTLGAKGGAQRPSADVDAEELVTILAHVAAGRAPSKEVLISSLRNASPTDGEFGDERRRFVDNLSTAVAASERLRRNAVQTWLNALRIARSPSPGVDERVPSPSGLRPSVTDRKPGPNSEAARLTDLVEETVRLFAAPRDGLLLAWSVAPLIDTLFDYAGSATARDRSAPSWHKLLEGYANVLRSLPETGRPRDEWLFPDVDERVFAHVRGSVANGTGQLRRRLKDEVPAGDVALGERWTSDPVAFLAALLGTSEAWIRGYDVVLG